MWQRALSKVLTIRWFVIRLTKPQNKTQQNKNYNPSMCTGRHPTPYPCPVSSMLGGGLSRSQEGLLSESSHLSSSALSSSQSESPLQTKDLLMHWPEHKKSHHTKIKEVKRKTLPGIKRFHPGPSTQHWYSNVSLRYTLSAQGRTADYFGPHFSTCKLILTLAGHKIENRTWIQIPGFHP